MHGSANMQVAVIAAAAFVLLTLIVTTFLIAKHVQHWNSPTTQQKIIRILMMAPVYSVDSWLSLYFFEHAVYFSAARDVYEAFVIYSFFSLMLDYLGGAEGFESKLRHKGDFALPFPFCMIKCKLDQSFVRRMKQGVLQYVLIKPITAIVSCITFAGGALHEGSYSPQYAFLYITIVENMSVCIALYALVALYQAAREPLKPHKPLAKFVIVKSVIFLTFWQGVFLGVLVYCGVIQDNSTFTTEEIKTSLQDFMICVEMLFAALAHGYAFGYESYRSTSSSLSQPLVQHLTKLPQVLSVQDVILDTRETFRPRKEDNSRAREVSLQEASTV